MIAETSPADVAADQLRATIAKGNPIGVVASNDDARIIETRYLVAPTLAVADWTAADVSMLAGADVIAVADNTHTGRGWARDAHQWLTSVAASVEIVGPQDGVTLAEHLAAGLNLTDDLVPIDLDEVTPVGPATPETVLDAARWMARELGCYVIELDHPDLSECAGRFLKDHDARRCRRGKCPTNNWPTTRTNTDRDIIQMFSGEPRNYGIATQRSRLLIIDEDTATLASYAASIGETVPETFEVSTGQGKHLYFRLPDGVDVANARGKLPAGIDVRAGKLGYVVGPCSKHASGRLYDATWDRRPVEAPAWLIEALRPTERLMSLDTGGADSSAAPGWLRDLLAEPGPPEGERSERFHALAGKCKQAGLSMAATVILMTPWCAANLDRYVGRVDEMVEASWPKLDGPKPKTKRDPFEGIIRPDAPAPSVPAGAPASGATLAATAEVAAPHPVDPAAMHALSLSREVERLRVTREAKQIVDAEGRPRLVLPDVLTLRERLAQPAPEVTWRIESWQPADARIVLAAQFKAGKTTLVGNLVRSLVDGDPFLGQYLVKPIDGRLALFDFEMSQRQLDGWLRDQGIVNDDRVVVLPMRGGASGFDLTDPACRTRWARLLREREVSYVMWDCLRPVMDALGLDENRDAGRLLVGFDALMAEAEASEALLVHHMGHSGERSRGDSRIRDWPDVEWRLVRKDENPAAPRFITAFGRDVDVPESGLAYDPLMRRLTFVPGSRKDAAVIAALAAVLDVVRATPKMSKAQIEADLGARRYAQKDVREAFIVGERDRKLVIDKTGKAHLVSSSDLVTTSSTRSDHLVSSSIENEMNTDTTGTGPRCQSCGGSLDSWLVNQGESTHPTCEAA